MAERSAGAVESPAPDAGPGVHSLSLAAIGAAAFLAARLLSRGGEPLPLYACPVRAATGWPCLGCGTSHAVVHLAHGDLLAALWSNPLAALACLALWAHALLTAARLAGLPWAPRLGPLARLPASTLRWALVGALGLNWAFVAFVSRGGAP